MQESERTATLEDVTTLVQNSIYKKWAVHTESCIFTTGVSSAAGGFSGALEKRKIGTFIGMNSVDASAVQNVY